MAWSGVRLLAMLGLALAVHGVTVAGGPWTQSKGEGVFQLSAYEIGPYGSLFLDGDRRFRVSRDVEDRTVEAYFEYGVSDRWTLTPYSK